MICRVCEVKAGRVYVMPSDEGCVMLEWFMCCDNVMLIVGGESHRPGDISHHHGNAECNIRTHKETYI